VTTGNVTVPFSTTLNSLGYSDPSGLYSYRNWSGNDRPKVPKQYLYRSIMIPKKEIVATKGKRRGEVMRVIPAQYKTLRKRIWLKTMSQADNEHSYTSSKTVISNPMGSYVRLPTDNPASYTCSVKWACGDPLSDPASVWSSRDDIALLGKLREKIVGSDFNLGVFLAESNEALSMIAGNAIKISNSISLFKRGRFVDAFRELGTASKKISGNPKTRSAVTTRDVAGLWLELQYGWTPLLKDVESAAVFLAHQFSVPPAKRYKVSRTIPTTGNGTCFPASSFNTLGYERSYNQTTKTITAIVEEIDVVGMLGLKDPLSIIWEKLPYSFVVDWFSPIGGYLSARGMAQSLKATYVTTTYWRLFAKRPIFKAPYSHNAALAYSYWSGTVSRTVSTTLSIPRPTVKPLEKAASWRHCVNALALLEQKLPLLAVLNAKYSR